ncbi:predicted protein [Sclerotinia sclerotiorum 1980 UF-70]|uniref:Uncharacterized protein n=1 Tax=Sclerotinia sclerotiorum (strain ATCC 18683 / 1980 / Ss-1) TaxID=665079 RepID=A7ECA1_SCLS1|nr:predicted protein [Sclerotinia sclerotiorum 1980 UF-70]EDO00080.1 predicted protein [Sclerotinia sclerotiorum 1980 UF-70]
MHMRIPPISPAEITKKDTEKNPYHHTLKEKLPDSVRKWRHNENLDRSRYAGSTYSQTQNKIRHV